MSGGEVNGRAWKPRERPAAGSRSHAGETGGGPPPARPAAGRGSYGWESREAFRARVREWAGKLEVEAKAIYIRPMTRKWASCSTAGTLSFNDELVGMERELGDYVIVHELLHFSVPNHGRLWKSLMRAHLGEYEALELRLKDEANES